MHNDVVMTPDPTLFFDAYQGSPRYEPLRDQRPDDGRDGLRLPRRPAGAPVLGVQGNLLDEFIPTAASSGTWRFRASSR